MSKKRPSYAFLMEMLWVCGFFALSSCIFVLAFGKAEQLSRQAQELNHAVSETQNCLEAIFATYTEGSNGPDGTGVTVYFYDKSWEPVSYSPADVFYTITVTTEEQDGLLSMTAKAARPNGDPIYTLEGAKNSRMPHPNAPAKQPNSQPAERRMP